MERTLFLIKSSVVDKSTEIIELLKEFDLQVVQRKEGLYTLDHWKKHYQEHEGKDFYLDLCQEMAFGPVIAMILEGPDAISRTRKLIGSTDPSKAEPGTLRRLYGKSVRHNGFHASDSIKSAEREICLWFD